MTTPDARKQTQGFNVNVWRKSAWTGLIAATLVGGCAAPYVDSRREAGKREPVGASTADLVAICTSSYGSNRDAAKKLADLECAKSERKAVFDHESSLACTLLAPTQVFYRCMAKP